jgi:hypothetical protein
MKSELPERQQPKPRPRESNWQKKLALEGLKVSRRTFIATIAAIIVAVALAIYSNSSDPGRSRQPPSSINVNQSAGQGSNQCVQFGDKSQCIQQLDEISARLKDDERFKDQVQKLSIADPTGSGPWQYVVIFTDVRGLKIRTTNDQRGTQIGTAANRSVIWADCLSISKFDPDPVMKAGPRWLRIRWPNRTPTTKFFNSEPGQKVRAYAYSGYTIPYGHNGNIPPCQ